MRLAARRPVVNLGTGSAHQHGAVAVAEAVGLDKRFDALLIAENGVGAGPVRTPQAAIHAPGVEHAG